MEKTNRKMGEESTLGPQFTLGGRGGTVADGRKALGRPGIASWGLVRRCRIGQIDGKSVRDQKGCEGREVNLLRVGCDKNKPSPPCALRRRRRREEREFDRCQNKNKNNSSGLCYNDKKYLKGSRDRKVIADLDLLQKEASNG